MTKQTFTISGWPTATESTDDTISEKQAGFGEDFGDRSPVTGLSWGNVYETLSQLSPRSRQILTVTNEQTGASEHNFEHKGTLAKECPEALKTPPDIEANKGRP